MACMEFDADDVVREFGDTEVIGELVAIVRVDLGKYAGGLDQAFAAGNLDEVRRLAHAIKGAAANVSAGEVCDLASTIDQALRTGKTEAASLAPSLVAACGRLNAELGLWVATLQQAENAAH